MKKIILSAFFLLITTSLIHSQLKTVNTGKYTYQVAENDITKTRIYKLGNGLTVYLSVNKLEPRIQTRIAVKAGSKNDPSDATGLAHYLEHMLFKGTSKFGTKDFEGENREINKVIDLFEVYRKSTDSLERVKLYHQIDSISGVASGYAIANEYDKMVASIGAKGTNAYTSDEETVYINEIPSNRLETWLKLESERFREPIMRLFHTELEVVYEEKNRSLDNGFSKSYEVLYGNLFKKHQYGTQTTIGTIEHLKNPSIKKVIEYYNTYYVPNNMAICLSGDFNPDITIELVDKYFGKFESKNFPDFIPALEDEIKEPVIKEVLSPESENLFMGYRLKGVGTKDADIMEILSDILYNGLAGLLDLNLNQSQKVLSSYAYYNLMKDYSVLFFSASPRQGQTLSQVKELLLKQLEIIKNGDFPDWYIPAVINNLKLSRLKSFEGNNGRVQAFVESFILGIPWDEYTNKIENLSNISKQDIIDFAKRNFKNNYVAVYKKTGIDSGIVKVVKPPITPVSVNRNQESNFAKEIINSRADAIQPQFIDYKKDIRQLNYFKEIPHYYKENTYTKTFELYYIVNMGTDHNKKLQLALNYLPYLGTSEYSPTEFKLEMFKIGCNYNVSASRDQIYVSLSGLSENFERAVELFESLLNDAQPDKNGLKNLIEDVIKKRENAKLNKRTILWSAMYNYGMFGSTSPFTNILSEKELKSVSPEELVSIIKEILTFKHETVYYGSQNPEEVNSMLSEYHKPAGILKDIPQPAEFPEISVNKNEIYIVDYNMKQVEIVMLSKGEKYDRNNIPVINLFNEYFGSGMSSVVFQELRESKALAYSTFASYRMPDTKEKSHFIVSYIGTQADKLGEAMEGMFELLNNMPESEMFFSAAKRGVIEQIQSERITRSAVIFNYMNARKFGLDYDIRRDIYEKVPQYSLSDLKTFHNKFIKDKNYTILILGDKSKLDMNILEKYGDVKFLTLDQVFGY